MTYIYTNRLTASAISTIGFWFMFIWAIVLAPGVWAQTPIPFVFQNTSPFPDSELFVAIVGQDLASPSHNIWIDCKTGAQNPMTNTYNTVKGPIYGGNAGPGGNAMYASCFTRLSEVPGKTVMLPGIQGCRVFISVGQQLYFYFFPGGGYTSPSHTDPTDPNKGIRYELIELTYDQYGFFGNTTRVDSYQYPIGLELYGANGYQKKVGELKSHEEIVSLWSANVPAEFQKCLNTATGVITAPSKTPEFADGTIGTMPVPGPYVDYLKPYIDQVWAKYTNEDLIFNAGDAGVFKGRVTGGQFSFLCTSGGFAGRTGTITRKPTTQEALEGKGVLDQTVNDRTVDLAIQAQITAALNRRVINVATPNVGQQDFSNAAAYYTAAPCNYYSKFWHLPAISIDQLSYGFAYDDVFNYSSSLHTSSPTRVVTVFGGYANASQDTEVPSVPTNLSVSAKTTASVTLAWNASTDNVGVTAYDVYVNAESTSRLTVSSPTAVVQNLTAGTAYTFRVKAKDAAGNASAYSNTLSVTTDGATGYQPVPGILEAESYSAMSGVQKEACSDTGGGENVGYIEAGDWMDYTVNVATAGTYTVACRVASLPGAGQFQLRNAAGTTLATVNVAATGDWQVWTTVQTAVTLPAGAQTLRIHALAAGWNLNKLTFTSPAVNIALHKTVTASGTENESTPANAATDGDASTRWSSAFTDAQWLYVDLGASYAINRVKITWEAALGKDYRVQVSDNAATWQTIREVSGNTGLVNDHTGLSATARYVRIEGIIRGTAYGYSIFELEVYGSPAAAATLLSEVSFYPNPAQYVLHTVGIDNGITVSITSATDGMNYTKTVENGNIDISSLPEGLYILKYNAAGHVVQLRFSKQ